MSRAEVRSAVANFFAPPAVAGLNTVYRSEPKIIQGQDFFAGAAAGIGTGAVGVVHIERESEQRRALGGATSGKKRIDYDVAMIIRFRSDLVSGTAAMDAYDTMIDGIKTRLRSDRQLNAAGTIFSAGEAGEQGGSDIEIISDLPVKEGQVVHIWTACRLPIPRRPVDHELGGAVPTYRFTGDTEEVFPDLSAVLKPGDEIDSDLELVHPRLERVGGAPAPAPAPSPAPVPEPVESTGGEE